MWFDVVNNGKSANKLTTMDTQEHAKPRHGSKKVDSRLLSDSLDCIVTWRTAEILMMYWECIIGMQK